MSATLEYKFAVSFFFMQDDLLTKIIKKLYDGAGGLHYPCVDLWRPIPPCVGRCQVHSSN